MQGTEEPLQAGDDRAAMLEDMNLPTNSLSEAGSSERCVVSDLSKAVR